MKYELIIETEVCTSFSNHIHNREGFRECLRRVNIERKKQNFISAKIISERDGVVFEM
jgi:hypothetical protein